MSVCCSFSRHFFECSITSTPFMMKATSDVTARSYSPSPEDQEASAPQSPLEPRRFLPRLTVTLFPSSIKNDKTLWILGHSFRGNFSEVHGCQMEA